MPVHIYSGSNGGDGQLVVVRETADDTTAYRFDIKQTDDEKKATFVGTIGEKQDAEKAPGAVREALKAQGYTLAPCACTDGNGEDYRSERSSIEDAIEELRSSLEFAKAADDESEREGYIKAALGQVTHLAATHGVRSEELHDQLTNAAGAATEEKPYFLNQSLKQIDELEGELEKHRWEETVHESDVPSENGDGDRTSRAALGAVSKARSALESIEDAELSSEHSSRVLTALETLDNILLDATGGDFLELADQGNIEHEPEELRETPESVVKERHAEASLDDTVPVTIELTPPIIELIDLVRDNDESVTDWIKNTIRTALALHDRKYWRSVSVPVKVELPPEAGRWARLWANHYAAVGVGDRDIESHMEDYVDLDFEWRLEGGEELDLGVDDDEAGGGHE